MFRIALVLVFAAFGLVVAAIGPAAAATFDIAADSATLTFIPGTVTLNVGDTVRWSGVSGHTVTSTSSNWSLNSTVDTTFTFSAAGTYEYVCNLHAGMGGRVVV